MIETPRLALTKPSLADLDESYAMSSDAAVMAFIGNKTASREEAWNKLLRNIGHWDAFGYGLFVVRDKHEGAFVGEVGLAHFSRGLGEAFDPFPEAAWVLAAPGHGRGYATEAVAAAHAWMAQTHRPSRTVCIIHPDNRASLRVAEKLGCVGFGTTTYREARLTMLERERPPEGSSGAMLPDTV